MRVRPTAPIVAVAASALALVTSGTASAASSTMPFANLTGDQVVTGPGDPDGTGAALVTLRPGQGRACASIRRRRIGVPTAIHIHRGSAGLAGPVEIDLTPALSGGACVVGPTALLREIRDGAEEFYADVHDAGFVDGAIRGQLEPSQVASALSLGGGPNRLFARMTGDQEVPGPGDPDGSGTAFVDLRPSAEQVCVDGRYRELGARHQMHIHRGVAGKAGEIEIDLTPALLGRTRCVDAPSPLILEIRANPERFYCNVHAGGVLGGAIRGQLE